MASIPVSSSSSSTRSWSRRPAVPARPEIIRKTSSSSGVQSSPGPHRAVLSVMRKRRLQKKSPPPRDSHTPRIRPYNNSNYPQHSQSQQAPEANSHSDDMLDTQPLTCVLPRSLINPRTIDGNHDLVRTRALSPASPGVNSNAPRWDTMHATDIPETCPNAVSTQQIHTPQTSPSCFGLSCQSQRTMEDLVIEEHPDFPKTLEKLTPDILEYILSVTDRRHIIRDVSPNEYAEWAYKYKLQSDSRFRFSYSAFDKVFIVECTSSLHQAFATYFLNRGAWQFGNLLGSDGCEIYFTSSSAAVEGFKAAKEEAGIPFSRKFPDGSVQVLDLDHPTIVIEVGFTEELPQLLEDAKLYLTKIPGGAIKTVIIVEMKETLASVVDENGITLTSADAKRRKFLIPDGFTEEGLLDDDSHKSISNLKNYYVAQDKAGKLVPPLLGYIDCTIHIYRLKTKPDNGGSSPEEGIEQAAADAGDGNENDELECTFISQFMVNNKFVPQEKKSTLSFTIQELAGDSPLPENLNNIADHVFTWPLGKFYEFLRRHPWQKMLDERAYQRANKVMRDLLTADNARKNRAGTAARERIRAQGLASGTRETRKQRASKRGLGESGVGVLGDGVDGVETFAQGRKRKGKKVKEEEEELEEEEEDIEEEVSEDPDFKSKARRRSNRHKSSKPGIKRGARRTR